MLILVVMQRERRLFRKLIVAQKFTSGDLFHPSILDLQSRAGWGAVWGMGLGI